jgi:hypothetical protein
VCSSDLSQKTPEDCPFKFVSKNFFRNHSLENNKIFILSPGACLREAASAKAGERIHPVR